MGACPESLATKPELFAIRGKVHLGKDGQGLETRLPPCYQSNSQMPHNRGALGYSLQGELALIN